MAGTGLGSKINQFLKGSGTYGGNWNTFTKTALGGAVALPLLYSIYQSTRNNTSNFDRRNITPEMEAYAQSGQQKLDPRQLAMAGISTLPIALALRGFRGKGLLGGVNNALKGTVGMAGAGALGGSLMNIFNNADYQTKMANSIRDKNIMSNPYTKY